MRVACKITITDEERRTLVRWSRGRRTPARLVMRAKIVLLAAEGKQNKDIGPKVCTDQQTVSRWRRRCAEKGLGGIEKDAPRGGRRPTRRDQVARMIIERTTQTKPKNATHWSVRSLARELGVSESMVARVWRANGLKPHLSSPFKLSNDPHWAWRFLNTTLTYCTSLTCVKR